jgi:Na+/H+ antiporter NhaC
LESSFFSVLPAIVAIVLAFWTRNVFLSLGVAIYVGACTIMWIGSDEGFASLYYGFGEMGDHIWASVSNTNNLKVTAFSLLVGAMVGVMAVSGGTKGLVDWLTRFARDRRSGMLTTWAAGLAIFFDDYANCMIVGSGMQPLADKLKFSRAKLAYIVDSTAAPIASLALISTWVGYEVSMMEKGIQQAVDQGVLEASQQMDAYGFFVAGIGYRFYCIFTIFFVMSIAMTGRDFGPMLASERLAQSQPDPVETNKDAGGAARAWLAILPLLSLIGVAMGYLYWSGRSAIQAQVLAGDRAAGVFGLTDIFGEADGYQAMLMASLAAVGVAVVLTLITRSARTGQVIGASLEGMGKMVGALGVLVLAWSLAGTIDELQAGPYLKELLSGNVPVVLFPTLVFALSAVTAFATGTSFGTMGILVPTVVFLSFSMSDDPVLHYAASGAVLSGACWGDHCSPISDTTVLSSLGSGCDHIEHVRTQMPYAIACGLISVLLGTLPVVMGVPLWACILLGLLCCWGVVRVLGRQVS